jgi:hypothetical protein
LLDRVTGVTSVKHIAIRVSAGIRAEVLYTDPEVAVMRVEHIRPYNIDLMSAEKVGNP